MQGFLIRIFLRFLWVSLRVFRVSFRIQTGKNKAKKTRVSFGDFLGFHLGIL